VRVQHATTRTRTSGTRFRLGQKGLLNPFRHRWSVGYQGKVLLTLEAVDRAPAEGGRDDQFGEA
jgi:hypothetical protein